MLFASQITVLRERLATQLTRMEATLSLGGSSEAMRHTIEASSLLKTVLSLLSSVGELERAWSIAGERASVDVTVLEARLAEARGELASRTDEVLRLRSALGDAEADADAARAETARTAAEGEIRATLTAEARAGELEAWKVSYAEERRRFGEARAADAASAARAAAEDVADAALRRLDSEARAAVSIALARADGCAAEAALAARAAQLEGARAADADARSVVYADAAAVADSAMRRIDSEARATIAIALARAEGAASEVALAERVAAAAEARASDAEARTLVYADAAAVADAALCRLDSEARTTLAFAHARADGAAAEALAAVRDAANHADVSRVEAVEARAAAASLADELLRARHQLTLERATAEEVSRLFAERVASDAGAAEMTRTAALETEALRHGADIERLRAGFDAAVRAREDSVADWRARYAAAAARAEHAETLVKAIDRQLAPHAAAALNPLAASLSNPALLARSWAAASAGLGLGLGALGTISGGNGHGHLSGSATPMSPMSQAHPHIASASASASSSLSTSQALADATLLRAATLRSPPHQTPTDARNAPWSNATLRALAAGIERREAVAAGGGVSSPSTYSHATNHLPSASPDGVSNHVYSDRIAAAARLKAVQNQAVAAVAAVASSVASSMSHSP